jgi:hydrogenase expression/formation protein HypC
MCLGAPGQIIKIVDAEKRLAQVAVLGTTRTISMSLLTPDEVQVGTWVLMHAGMALRHIEEDQASRLLQLIKELDQAYEEEQV